ncbi:aminotransferase in exopolysaccharide biosynthesis [Marinoscillum furvescens DSM 4134]|uniref:GDP-perosamine synthase n=2 Tax=Marinoscillum furvescens TaxID=1026 RepID=A0A3D9L9A3_MARFU|nr:aminotransferase in exopolysaccharide biosynthesis [Marinoscillum furvescens DSM 4134]
MSEIRSFVELVQSIYGTKDFIPLHEPRFDEKEKRYLAQTIDSTFVSSVGEFVDKFEAAISNYCGAGKAAAVVNGTAALQVALRIAGVNNKSEVITQALTFVATANAISYNGASPVFVDVDYDTMGLSPLALRNFLNEFGELRETGAYNKSTGKRISAIVPMHTFGFMCRIDEIVEIANEWNIPVVEDSAESLGSSYKGKHSGTFGLMGAFSFNGNKIITSGGGGAIVSSDPQFANKAKYLTNTAKVPHAWDYYHDEIGYNFRMPNLNAALGLAQFEKLNEFIESKKTVYEIYCKELDSGSFRMKEIPVDTEWNYWLFPVEFQDQESKNKFMEYTNSNNVMTRPIWQLMYKLPMYENSQRDAQINTKLLAERIVNIPSSAKKV